MTSPENTQPSAAPTGPPMMEPPAPKEPFDYTGYQVIEQTPEGGGQTTWAVVNSTTGVGLGAYATTDDVERVITRDKQQQAEREAAAEQARKDFEAKVAAAKPPAQADAPAPQAAAPAPQADAPPQ